jgi:hypothetical protein
LADGLRIWAARDVYRWLRAATIIYALVLLCLLSSTLSFLRHRQDRAALAMGVSFLLACYAPLLLRALCRWGRGRWLLVLVLAGLLSGGCVDAGRWLAKARGIQIDPFPGECRTAESVQVGHCVPVAKGGTP